MRIQISNIVPTMIIILVISIFIWAANSADTGQSKDREPDGHVEVISENGSIKVTAGTYNLSRTPFSVEWEGEVPSCMESDGDLTPVQYEEVEDGHNLLWVLPLVPAQQTRVYEPSQRTDCRGTTFEWETHRIRLLVGGIPAIEYIAPKFDQKLAEATMKPFHHVYAPDGSRKITKGAGGLYSHHRGIFYGYSNVRINDGERMNFWAASTDRGEFTEHSRLVQQWEGPVFGGHEVEIEWRAREGEVIADEVRSVRVYRRPAGELLIDIETVLTSGVDGLHLGGDLHHAGLQFRAAQYVADNPENSRYLRPEAWANHPMDEEINDPEQYINQPWNAFRFVVEGDPYTVGFFSHPKNPEGGEMSERLYGRFGEYIPDIALDRGESHTLKYRLLIADGHRMGRNRMDQEYSAYAGSR